MTKRRWLWPFLVLALFVVLAIILVKARPTLEKKPLQAKLPNVQTMIAKAQRTRFSYPVQGLVYARSRVDLVAEVAGQIKRLSGSFAEGGHLAKGDLGLQIDPREYDLGVIQAQAQVAQAEAQLLTAEAETEQAQRDWQRLGQGREASPLALKQPQLAQAKAQLQSAKAALAKARIQRERCDVRMPFPAQVVAVKVQPGQFVQPGMVLATIYDDTSLEVRLSLADQWAADVELPQTITLRAGRTEMEARLERRIAEVDSTTRMRDFIATLKPGGLLPGHFVETVLYGLPHDEIYALPPSALYQQSQVMVVEEGHGVLRRVNVRYRDSKMVYVDKGLNEGDQFISALPETVVDGMALNVIAAGGVSKAHE